MATDSITLQKICQNKSVKAIWREFSIQNLLPSLFPRFDCWRDVRNVIVECPQSDTQLCFINVAKASGGSGTEKVSSAQLFVYKEFSKQKRQKINWLFAKIRSNNSWLWAKIRPIWHQIREIQRLRKRKVRVFFFIFLVIFTKIFSNFGIFAEFLI